MSVFTQFWFQMVEVCVPHLHLHHFSSDCKVVALSVMCIMADDCVLLMESDGESDP